MGEIGTTFGGVPAPDPLAQFLGRVVAWGVPGEPDSYVNIHAFTPKYAAAGRGQFARKGGGRAYASMIEYGDLTQFLWQLNRDGDEVFFCISTRSGFKGQDPRGNRKASRSRKAGNLPVRLKSFVLDLDVKAKGYASQRAALAAVLPVFDRWGIKPTIVDTGWGLHAYITLAERITPAVWQPLANALVEAAKQAGLKFDVAVTRDDDRILRLPTSFNRKVEGQEKISRLLVLGEDTPLAHLEQILLPYRGISPTAAAPRANGHAPKLDLSFLPPRPPITRGPDVDRVRAERERLRVVTSFDLLAEACRVVQDSEWRGGNGDREPLWFELAKLCHYVEDGLDHFHRLSEQDPRYDEDQTDAKYEQAEPQGWPACATIEASSDDAARICRTCPLYGQGKSPIHAATRGDPPGEASGGQVNGHVNGHALSAAFQTAGGPPPTPIWVPEGYKLDQKNFLWTPEDQLAFTVPIYHVNAVYEDGQKLMEFVFDNGTGSVAGPSGHCFIEASTTASRAKFAEAGNGHGLHVNHFLKERHVAVDLLTQIQQSRTAHTYQRCGWTDDGFVYGGSIYTKDGPRPTSSRQADIGPRGTLEAWKAAVHPYIGHGCIDMEVFMASAFAAPLMCFTPVPGGIMFTHSPKSGRGKSASLFIGASVWYPSSYVVKVGTNNFALSRLATLNNLPFYFDELVVASKEAKSFADMIKAVASGSEPGRLDRSSRERPQRLSSTIMGANANRSLIEIARTPDSDAQAARVFEYQMPATFEKVRRDIGDTARYIKAMDDNCGTAGAVYAEFLGRHRDVIEALVIEELRYWQRRMRAPDGERFWVSETATIIVGATIAKKLGLMDFDIVAMRAWFESWFLNQRIEVADMRTDAEDPEVQMQRVRDFVNENLNKRIVTEEMPKPGNPKRNVLNKFEMNKAINEIVMCWAQKEQRLWLSEPKLEAYCKQIMRQYSYSTMRSVLVKAKLCKRHRDGRYIGAGTEFSTAKEIVLEFDLTDPRGQFNMPDYTTGESQ